MTQTPDTIARDYLDGQNSHDRLDAWLKGRDIDAALKAMNISAVAKKPGRVTKRVAKVLSNLFEAPRVVQWDKEMKVVYAPAFTAGRLEETLRADTSTVMPYEEAIFQTDLYFRANQDVTEVNASTIAAISLPAMRDLVEIGGFDHEAGGFAIKKALSRARIVQTGLADSSIETADVRQILIPMDDLALVAISMPIERIEFDEDKTGQVVVVLGVRMRTDLSEAEGEALDALAEAMTKDGHPGRVAFGKMIDNRLCDLTPNQFSK